MSPDSHDSKTLNAYLHLLEGKGVQTGSIYKRKHFLQYLLSRLKDKPQTRQSYGEAMELALITVANEENIHYFRGIAREFYHFWMNDLKAIALFNTMDNYIEPFQIEVSETLDELVEKIRTIEWTAKEAKPLHAYTAVLAQQGAKQKSLERREKIAKILLLVLHGYPVNSATYHAAVEAITPLFSHKDTKRFFLHIAREFFYFWIGDTSATARVNFQPTDYQKGPDTKS